MGVVALCVDNGVPQVFNYNILSASLKHQTSLGGVVAPCYQVPPTKWHNSTEHSLII